MRICPRILEHRSLFSGHSSADFGPRLPENQLYVQQKKSTSVLQNPGTVEDTRMRKRYMLTLAE